MFKQSTALQTPSKAFLYEIVAKGRVRKGVQYDNTLDTKRGIGELERGKDLGRGKIAPTPSPYGQRVCS